jgi:hypothetical protein
MLLIFFNQLVNETILFFQQLSKKEVEELLRKGAYGAVMDETNESSKFSEEDIDTILQRRTQTITIQPGVKVWCRNFSIIAEHYFILGFNIRESVI